MVEELLQWVHILQVHKALDAWTSVQIYRFRQSLIHEVIATLEPGRYDFIEEATATKKEVTFQLMVKMRHLLLNLSVFTLPLLQHQVSHLHPNGMIRLQVTGIAFSFGGKFWEIHLSIAKKQLAIDPRPSTIAS